MNSFPDPSQAKPPLQLSGRNLSVVSLVLFTLFGTIVLGSTLPRPSPRRSGSCG